MLTLSAKKKQRETNIYSKLEQLLKPTAQKRGTPDSMGNYPETPSPASETSEKSNELPPEKDSLD